MLRRPPVSTRNDTHFPDTTLVRSAQHAVAVRRQPRHVQRLPRQRHEHPAARLHAQRRPVLEQQRRRLVLVEAGTAFAPSLRSEGHTSELKSLMRITYAVFCLKKKKSKIKHNRSLHTYNIFSS